MARLATFLKEASIFKNHLSAEHASVAVKGDAQVFTAVSNVVKTGPAFHHQNYFKIADIKSVPPFKVNALLLNGNDSLLAVVGDYSVALIDVKSKADFGTADPLWSCFDISIKLPKTAENAPSKVKQVLWHPGSPTFSEIVVLTQTDILLYDVVFSLAEPKLRFPLAGLAQLQNKGVSSITFGSTAFAGSLTLYLSTSCGEIYAIYPFTHTTSKIATTKAQIQSFVEEWDSVIASYDNRLPPALAFMAYRSIFADQTAFVSKLEARLKTPIFAEAEPSQCLDVDVGAISPAPALLGPLAKIGNEAKLVHVNADSVPVLAAVSKDPAGTAIITYLSQIIPLSVSIQKPKTALSEPAKPVQKPKQPKVARYVRPARGFGYVIESDDEDDGSDTEFAAQMAEYQKELGYFHEKRKIEAFIDSTFNKLTVLATDSTALKFEHNTRGSFQMINPSKLMLASGKSILIGDTTTAVAGVLSPTCTSFEVDYKLVQADCAATGFAYVNDTIEGSGEYLIAYTPSDDVSIVQVEDLGAAEKPLSIKPSNPAEKRLAFSERKTTLPAEELNLIKAEGERPLSLAEKVDFSLFESLSAVDNLTSDVMRKVSSLTKFLLVLQMKVQIQLEDLRQQTRDLRTVTETVATKEAYDENLERIQKLAQRQESLIEREEKLRLSLVDRFEKARAAQSLPLSRAEKDWFNELNSITKTLASGDEAAPGMAVRIDVLKTQVEALKAKKEKQSAVENLDETLAKLQLGPSLSKLASKLSHESDLLLNAKDIMDGCVRRLDDSLKA